MRSCIPFRSSCPSMNRTWSIQVPGVLIHSTRPCCVRLHDRPGRHAGVIRCLEQGLVRSSVRAKSAQGRPLPWSAPWQQEQMRVQASDPPVPVQERVNPGQAWCEATAAQGEFAPADTGIHLGPPSTKRSMECAAGGSCTLTATCRDRNSPGTRREPSGVARSWCPIPGPSDDGYTGGVGGIKVARRTSLAFAAAPRGCARTPPHSSYGRRQDAGDALRRRQPKVSCQRAFDLGGPCGSPSSRFV